MVSWYIILILIVYVSAPKHMVSGSHVCSDNCTTTSTDLNSGKPSDISCTIHHKPCLNIPQNRKSDIGVAIKKEQIKDWSLYFDEDNTKIFLNFSWGPNQDSTISGLKGYTVVIKGKEIMRQHYCLGTELAFHNHTNAVFHSNCYGKSKEQEIEPGDVIDVSILNVPRRQNKASFKIRIPTCEESSELANVSKCLKKSQFYVFVHENTINCNNGGVSFNYSVPRNYQFASTLLIFDDQEIATRNLPISSDNYTVEVIGYELNKNYTMQVWGENELYKKRQVIFNFGSCINSQKINLEPILVPIVFVIFILIIIIIVWYCGSPLLLKLKNCIAINPNLKDCAVQVSGEKDDQNRNEIKQPLNCAYNVEETSYQIPEQDTGHRTKVYIVFVADNKHHQKVMLKFADYLFGDLHFEVRFELWEKLAITKDYATWMMDSCNDSEKVIVIWSQGAKKRYLKQNQIFQDLFTPVLNHIKNDLFLRRNSSKYYFGYFDYCSAEEVIPDDFQQFETRTFNLMKGFEDLYFLLKKTEKYRKGKTLIQSKAKFESYADPQVNKHGPYLQQAIMETRRFARESSNWFDSEEQQEIEELLEGVSLNLDANQTVIKIIPPRPILRIQTKTQVDNSGVVSSNVDKSDFSDYTSYMCSDYEVDDYAISNENTDSDISKVGGILRPPSEEFSDPLSVTDQEEGNNEEESCSFVEPLAFTSGDFQNDFAYNSEPAVPIFRPPVDLNTNPMESLKQINSYI